MRWKDDCLLLLSTFHSLPVTPPILFWDSWYTNNTGLLYHRRCNRMEKDNIIDVRKAHFS